MMKKIKIIFLTAVLTTGLFLPASVNAQLFEGSTDEACKGATAGSGNCRENQAANKLETTIGNIVDLLTVVVGIIAVIMIIINGFRFITSGGDSNTVSAARNGILYALAGLVIVVLAQVIVRFVLGTAT